MLCTTRDTGKGIGGYPPACSQQHHNYTVKSTCGVCSRQPARVNPRAAAVVPAGVVHPQADRPIATCKRVHIRGSEAAGPRGYGHRTGSLACNGSLAVRMLCSSRDFRELTSRRTVFGFQEEREGGRDTGNCPISNSPARVESALKKRVWRSCHRRSRRRAKRVETGGHACLGYGDCGRFRCQWRHP